MPKYLKDMNEAELLEACRREQTKHRGGKTMKSIYKKLVESGAKTDHHETDLYVLVTPETTAIINGYEFKGNVTTFTSKLDGKQWYDIPFAYEPNSPS